MTSYLPLCYLVNEASPVTLMYLAFKYGLRMEGVLVPLVLAGIVGYAVLRMYVWLWEDTDVVCLVGMLICPLLLGFMVQAAIGPYSGGGGIDYIGAAIAHTLMFRYAGAVVAYVAHVICAIVLSRPRKVVSGETDG